MWVATPVYVVSMTHAWGRESYRWNLRSRRRGGSYIWGFRVLLPDDRGERLELLRADSTAYIRRMGRFELLKVVEGLMRSGPLSEHDVDELLDERYPVVSPEWIPEEQR